MKKTIDVQVKTIQQILDELDFLDYSTYKRNLSYQIQYLNFLYDFEKKYNIYLSVRSLFMRNYLIHVVNIIEYLLVIALRQIDSIPINSNNKSTVLISKAKRTGLISKTSAKDLSNIFIKRNKLHPKKQGNILYIQNFGDKDMRLCNNLLDDVLDSMRNYFSEMNVRIKEEFQEEQCSYCYSGISLIGDKGICQGCGDIIFS